MGNKRRFLIGSGVAAVSVYFAIEYLKSWISEGQDRLTKKRLANENLRRRFLQNQQDATYTVMSLLPQMVESILEQIQVENITKELQAKRKDKSAISRSTLRDSEEGSTPTDIGTPSSISDSRLMASITTTDGGSEASGPSAVSGSSENRQLTSGKSRAQLWNELKIQSLTRVITLVYSVAMLTFFTRLQLNLLGRKSYIASLSALSESSALDTLPIDDLLPHSTTSPSSSSLFLENESDLELSRQYLTFSWWLLNRGWMTIAQKVEIAVTQVFGSIDPRAELSAVELHDCFDRIQKEIDSQQNQLALECLLPPQDQEQFVLSQASSDGGVENEHVEMLPGLRELINESTDLIESPSGSRVLSEMIQAGLDHLIEHIHTSTIVQQQQQQQEENEGKITEIKDRGVKVASILAAATKQAHVIAQSTTNDYLRIIDQVTDLTSFSALVYSNYDDYDLHPW